MMALEMVPLVAVVSCLPEFDVSEISLVRPVSRLPTDAGVCIERYTINNRKEPRG
jgi:hypothetical protein